jgi:hypothetical protein
MRPLSIVSVAALLMLGSRVIHAQASGAAHANHGQPRPSDSLTALITDPLGSRTASGTATVTGTAVRVTWAGDQAGAVRTWSVRRGSCSRDEGGVGAMSAYAPITVNESGSGTSRATLDAALTSDAQYHVVIHGSATAATASSLGCGALRAWAMPPSSDSVLTSSPNGSRPMPVDHSTMNHSAMATPPDSTGATPSASISMPGMSDSTLMAIHMRMMADPVIRERVMTDPVLQRMMAGMPGMSPMKMDMTDTASARMKDSSRTEAPAPRATRGATTKPASKPVAKPAAKPAPVMPGMDHSKMPVKRKPSE